MYAFLLKRREDGRMDLALDSHGRDLVPLRDDGLTCQTLECLVGSAKGEWFLNEDEGLDFTAFLGQKMSGITVDRLKTELVGGLAMWTKASRWTASTMSTTPRPGPSG